MPTSLSRLDFAAYLAYSPRGTSETSKKSRTLTYDIKVDRNLIIGRVVDHLVAALQAGTYPMLDPFFGPDTTLVPCPRSSLMVSGALWPGERICTALQKRGFGKECVRMVERHKAVSKSSTAKPGQRPTVQDHLDSLRVTPKEVFAPLGILLVDDVVTRGATLIAAASHLAEAFPRVEIRAFALVRTMSFVPEVTQLIDPCAGVISCSGGMANRAP